MQKRATEVATSLTVFLLGFVAWILGSTPQVSAIPAFSRKYQTSCTTCHSNYPELNDFGEAFKKNGFKFPKDDELFVKDPPILLGAKAQKEVFPKAVYPGEIPGGVPIAFRYSGNFTYNSKQPLSLGFLPRTDLFVPNTFTIIGAGSLGQTLSFWIDNDISAGGANKAAGLGDGYLKVNDLGHYIGLPKDTINLRMGQFELDLPFTQARTINLTPYDIYNEASIAGVQGTTNNPFVFGIPQRGIEIGGYPNDGNFTWSVALVDGSNNTAAVRNSKDVYVRVSQRFNLERDPKVRAEVQAAGPTGPRDHTSIRFGAFYYYGRNALNTDGTTFPGIGSIQEPFYRAGGDVRFKYRNLELYGLGMYGHDTNQIAICTQTVPIVCTGTQHTTPVTFSGGFGEAEYWIYPWMIALMRYDFVNSPTDFLNGATGVNPGNGIANANTRNRFSPGMQFLVRANIKVAFEYQHRWEQPVPNTTVAFRPNGFVSGIDFVF
ncbi:MAG: hypothetical protein ACRD50_03040 [Candidatus Acidiferrales bacterium]